MRASAQIRQYASKFANTNPEVAFDLLDLSAKIAQEEQEQSQQEGQQKQGGELPPGLKEHMEKKEKEEGQDQGQKQAQQGQQQQDSEQGQEGEKQAYTKLKSACISVATSNPQARQALLPVLKLIKSLG